MESINNIPTTGSYIRPVVDWNKYQSADCYARWAYEIPKYMKMNKLKMGDTISMLNKEGVWEDYYFLPMHSNHKGLSGIIYIPKNFNQEGVSPEIIVTFRGTIFSDADSVQRNLEIGGPGYKSFVESKENFMLDIEAALAIFYQDAPNVKVQVVGHSLGGADAQFLTLALIEKIMDNPSFSKINAIDLMVHNSVGVSHEVVKESEALLERLDNHHMKIDIDVHYGMVAGDGLQQFGESMIFHNSSYDQVKLDLLKIHTPYEGSWSSTKNLFEFYAGFFGTIKTHSQSYFGGKLNPEDTWVPPSNEYIFLSNKNIEDIPKMQSELLNKSEYVSRVWVQSVKNTCHALLDWIAPWMEVSSQAPTIVHHSVWTELVNPEPYNQAINSSSNTSVNSVSNTSSGSTPSVLANSNIEIVPEIIESVTNPILPELNVNLYQE